MRHEKTKPGSRQAGILAAATRVWAADPSASLERIAAEAGVGRATLNRYFPARADLLRAAAIVGISELKTALVQARLPKLRSTEALRVMVEVLVQFGDRLHFVLVAGELIGDAEIAAAEALVDGKIHAVIDQAVRAGILRADLPRAWKFRTIEALVYAAWTAVTAGELAPLDAPGLVHDTILRGLGS